MIGATVTIQRQLKLRPRVTINYEQTDPNFRLNVEVNPIIKTKEKDVIIFEDDWKIVFRTIEDRRDFITVLNYFDQSHQEQLE